MNNFIWNADQLLKEEHVQQPETPLRKNIAQLYPFILKYYFFLL